MTLISRAFLPVVTLTGATATLLASGCDAAPTDPILTGDSTMATHQSATLHRHFRNGTYTATGLYGGLPSKLTVTATVTDDRLAEVSVKTHATDPTSLDYQRRFAAAVPAVVKGKRIDEVKVGKLAGASGCPDGFKAALAKIRDQAAQ